VQLRAWLPVNTDWDILQCASRQISTVKHSLLWIVSATLVVFPLPLFQHTLLLFPNEWISYLPIPLHVSQLFLLHHTYPLPMPPLQPILQFLCHFLFIEPFETFESVNNYWHIFRPTDVHQNFWTFFQDFAIFRAELYEIYFFEKFIHLNLHLIPKLPEHAAKVVGK